ncbi:GTPase ObgE [bacterium]|nr:GTPase ObgE [bacterium]
MFIDSVKIYIRSGNGGRGCVSFLREKYRPRGGPDGGDGGRGGDVVFITEPRLNTLLDFHYQQHFKADHGQPGQGRKRSGKSAEPLPIRIPIGTSIYDDATGTLLGDLSAAGQELIVARGGRGGKGNAHFASSTQQVPRFAQQGEQGQELWLRLELKLLADVGIIGYPNVGKSTFIARISAARPKIADFPFTTLEPHLGVARFDDNPPIVFADIPGIIEGAHQGKGLGLKFLKHIERTRLLLHFIDPTPLPERDPVRDYQIIQHELVAYHKPLGDRPQFVIVNKCDIPENRERADPLEKLINQLGGQIFYISAVTGAGTKELLSRISLFFQSS